MRYFLKTRDQRYVDVFKQLVDMAEARRSFFREKVKSWGFDEFSCYDFGGLHHLYVRVPEEMGKPRFKGPAIEGFKGGDRVHTNGGTFFMYSFHGRNKRANELMRELEGAPPVPSELLGREGWSRQHTISGVFAARLGLADGVFSGNRLLFASVYNLNTGWLVCSLPVDNDPDSREYAPAVIPDGFEEITERAWGELIDEHNRSIPEAE